MKKSLLLLLGLAYFLLPQANAQVYINEWMSSNSSVISDPDFDESGDWIELFNDFNDTINLTGHFLSDNFNEPTKWAFPPNTKIPPNDFLIIWADGENTGLHSNFKLTKDGEEIGLYDADTLSLDSLVYSFQQTNVSMGRTNDGSSSFSFFLEPTPGSSNNTEAYTGLTFYKPHFSVKGGFYESQVELSLTTISGTIRYTLDGSLPIESSTEYSSPLQITETTNVRARVFQDGFIPGKPVTHTYFFGENFEERGLPVVSISTNPEYFWDTEIGLYVQDFKPSWEYPINIELFENDRSDRAAFNELAGTRVNGLNSWELPQKMLGIYFDNDYDQNNLEYQLFFDGDRKSFDNFTLRAGGSDWASTLFRDALCQGLTDENMDLERMAYRPAIAYINGEYMGVHNLRSRIDEDFIEENFGYASNEYDLIENDGEVEEGDDIAYNEFFALFDEDLTNAANFQAVEDVMDLQNFTDYFITEIWTSNSSYGHNIQLWKPKNEGKWRWILQDFDRGLSGVDYNAINYFTTSTNNPDYAWCRKILTKMLENEEYGLEFAQRFADHMYTTFHPERVKEEIIKSRTKLEAEIPNHVDRWAGTMSNYGDGLPSVEFWETQVQNRIDFGYGRYEFMLGNVRDVFSLNGYADLGTMSLPADAGHIFINDLKIPGSPWNGSYFLNLPFELNAEAKAGYQFEGWSLASFETLIEEGADWKYLDDGSDQGADWRNVDFNDASWDSGAAELGYGDGDEQTVIEFGGNANDKAITSYFRKTINIANAADYTGMMSLRLRRDDGAVIYLNGEEIVRSNMPGGEILFDTGAAEVTAGENEDTFYSFSFQTELLVTGENVLAVEVHQENPNSSDVSFNLELKALKIGEEGIFTSNEFLPVTLSADTFFVANYLPTGECLLAKEISENTTLTIDCSPYLVPDDVRVFEDVTLTIEPGVELHFDEGINLTVNGNMQAEGTEALPIIFKSITDEEAWSGVHFKNTSSQSRINWLEIIDADRGEHPIYNNAAISGFYADLDMENLTIENVFNNPILAYYSDISLKNSQLHSEVTGDLINVKYGNAFIENCTFRGNDQVDTDAVDYDEVENGIVRNSKIFDFFGFNSDGIDLGEESSDVLLENNFIHNCSDKGVSVGQLSTIFMQNNTIVNCAQGIAVKDLSTAEVDQNTFYNVGTPIACFEKNVGIGGGMAFVTNSILSNSPESPILVDEQSVLSLNNTLSDTEAIEGENNVLGHPHFTNPTQNDFHLMPNSLALNAGLNETGNVIDLGTKYYDYSAIPSLMISKIMYHPLDDADAEFIQILNAGDEAVDLTDYQISEAVDFIFPAAQIAPNEEIRIAKDADLFPNFQGQLYTWTDGKLSNNGEAIRLSDAYGIVVDQVIYSPLEPWAVEAAGTGASLVLISPDLDNHFAESWEVETVVRLEELEGFTGINIFPNPSTGQVSIDVSMTAPYDLTLRDVVGNEVLKRTLRGQNTIDLSSFSQGVYFVSIWSEDKELMGNRKLFLVKD